jgi:hypothetical protein
MVSEAPVHHGGEGGVGKGSSYHGSQEAEREYLLKHVLPFFPFYSIQAPSL